MLLPEAEEAVTVTLDVPAGVPVAGAPLELSGGGEESPPLQLVATIARINGNPVLLTEDRGISRLPRSPLLLLCLCRRRSLRDRRRIVRRFSGSRWQPYKFFTLLTLGSIVPLLPSVASAVSCEAVVGKWAWFVGGEVTINADGTFTQKFGNSGTWKCTDASKGAVALKWKQGGYLNRLALADGGTKLVSTDPSQSFVKATRINQEQALADILTRQDTVSAPSSSRRPSGQPGGTVPMKPSTPLAGTQKKGPTPFDSPQGFVHSDPKVEARFKQGYDLFTKKNYAAAYTILIEVGQAGHPRAQALLGRTYQEGLGQAKDYKQAAEWYGKAAAQGHRMAQFSLGNLYFERCGEGSSQSHPTLSAERGPRLRPGGVHLGTLL